MMTRTRVEMTDKLKKADRALLELVTGILVFALIAQLTGLLFPINKMMYSAGLWMGIAVALFSAIHMWHSLQKAFSLDEKGAAGVMAWGYVLRYLITGAMLILLFYTGIGYPLAGFLGILGLKAGAYLQPLTHKFYNFIFHETDPVPQPFVDEEPEVYEEE